MALFSDPVHQEFSGWSLGFAPYGGADVGAVEQIATQVKPGDDRSFFDAFAAMAHRRIDEGDAAARKGHKATARDCSIRAASLLGVAYHPLYGTPVDPRLADAFHLQTDLFEKAIQLGAPGR
jgi:hypothetical protein